MKKQRADVKIDEFTDEHIRQMLAYYRGLRRKEQSYLSYKRLSVKYHFGHEKDYVFFNRDNEPMTDVSISQLFDNLSNFKLHLKGHLFKAESSYTFKL